MTASSTAAGFDLAALRRGVEQHDAAIMLSLYGDNADMVITDQNHPPSTPQVMHGRTEISSYLGDVYSRDMTHTLDHVIASGNTVSFVERCQYPDGSQVTFSSVLDIDDAGHISHQEGVQAWDMGGPAAEYKDFARPDEVREFDKGRLEILHLSAGDVGRMTLQPGWRWSESVRPLVGTDLCMVSHFGYQISGTLRIQMADGSTIDARPGTAGTIPPGHDAWVVGDEPALLLDWAGATNYAQKLAVSGR